MYACMLCDAQVLFFIQFCTPIQGMTLHTFNLSLPPSSLTALDTDQTD